MGRNAPHRERRTERPFPRRHERNARAWALHRSAYGLTTVPIPCVAVPSWKIELLFMTFHPSPACRALLHLLYLLLGRPCHSVVLVGTSQTCRGCRENFSLPGCGAAPHIPSIPTPFHPTQSACASTPPASVSLCPLCAPLCSPKSAFPALCVLCDFQSFWQSFVHLRGPSCSSCQPRRANPPQFPHPSIRRPAGALSVLCGRGRFGPLGLHAPFSVLRGGTAAPPGLHGT